MQTHITGKKGLVSKIQISIETVEKPSFLDFHRPQTRVK